MNAAQPGIRALRRLANIRNLGSLNCLNLFCQFFEKLDDFAIIRARFVWKHCYVIATLQHFGLHLPGSAAHLHEYIMLPRCDVSSAKLQSTQISLNPIEAGADKE